MNKMTFFEEVLSLERKVFEQNFRNLDFYVSKSNVHVFNLINNWPTVNEKFLNIMGEKFCGKSHLINIFLEKNKGLKINSDELNNHYLKKIKYLTMMHL